VRLDEEYEYYREKAKDLEYDNLRRQDEEQAIAAAPRDDEVSVPETAEKEPPWYSKVGEFVSEVGRQAGDAAVNVPQGAVDAIQNSAATVEASLDDLLSQVPEDFQPERSTTTTVPYAKQGEADTVSGGLSREAAQFLTGFMPWMRGFKAAGMNPRTAEVAAGAATGGTAIAPTEETFAEAVRGTPLEGVVSEALASDEDTGEYTARFQNMIEEGVFGTLTMPIMNAVGSVVDHLKKARKARAKPKADLKPVEVQAQQRQLAEGETATRPPAPVEMSEEQADDMIRAVWSGDSIPEGSGVNFDYFTDEADLTSWLDATDDVLAKSIEKQLPGNLTNAQVLEQARREGLDVEAFKRSAGETKDLALKVTRARLVLKSSTKKLEDLAQEVFTNPNPNFGDELALRRQAILHGAIYSHYRGIRTNVGQALQAFKINLDDEKGRRLVEMLGGQKTSKELAEAVLENKDNPAALREVTEKGGTMKFLESVRELRQSMLLFNVPTQVVNAMGNSYMIAHSIGEKGIAAAYGSGKVTPDEIAVQLMALRQAVPDAMRMAGQAFKRGEPAFDAMTKMETHTKAISGEGFGWSGGMGRFADYTGNAIRLPFRAMSGADDFFKVLNFRMEQAALATRQIQKEGLTDPTKIKQRYAQLTADPSGAYRMDLDSKKIYEESLGFARKQTFTEELQGASRLFERALNETPLGVGARVIVPFFRTPTNIVRQVARRSPIGPLSKEIQQDFAAGGARRDMALAKLSTGTAMMTLGYQFALEGNITGSLPADPREAQRWREAGVKPYSVKVGDEWVAYNRMDPLGMWLGLSADYALFTENGADMDSSLDMVSVGVQGLYENLKDKTFFRSAAELVNALTQRQDDSAENLQRYARRLLASSVTPAGMAQATNTGVPGIAEPDPYIRDVWTTWEALKARVPGFSTDVPPMRDLYGDPVMKGGSYGPDLISPFYSSVEKTDKVRQELMRLKIGTDRVSKKLAGVELTHEQYDEYTRLAGKSINPMTGLDLYGDLQLLIEGPEWDMLSEGDETVEGERQRRVRELISIHREQAREEMRWKYPDLDQALWQLENKKRDAKVLPQDMFEELYSQ